jgi:CRP-like cAMP-binding protein
MSDLALDQAYSIGIGEAQVRFPTVLDRLIHLRSLQNLGGLAGTGLTFIATHAEERHYAAGDIIYRPGEPVAAAHLIAEGRIRVEQEGVHLLDGVPPFAVGFFPLIANSQVGQSAVAVEPTVTLEVSRADLFEIFEDDFGFLLSALRTQSRQLANTQEELEVRGLLIRSEPEDRPYPTEQLDFVARLELSRRGPYVECNLEPLVQLARQAEELRFEPGDVIWEEGDAATLGATILYGVVECVSEKRSFRMGPGSNIGLIESIGLMPRSYRAVAETRVVALKQGSEVLLDVLEDNPSMAMDLLSFLSKVILDLSLRLARAKLDDD